MEWMFLPLKRYADFSGRSRRREFWMFSLLNILVLIGLTVVIVVAAPGGLEEPGLGLGSILLLVWMLGTLIPHLAVQVRRFHDQDKSGWWVLIGLIPYLGGLVLIVFMCFEGTRGHNNYGPDPKEIPATS